MYDHRKYQKQFYLPPIVTYDWARKLFVEKAPLWCSVDLRDGNQALAVPMSLKDKLEMFELLVAIGFKEIEVAFPAASETEFKFLRILIEEKRIPEDVTIQVITQAREHIIRRTFEALEGVPRAIVHLYNSTSEVQRRQVFKKSREEIRQIAVSGAKYVKLWAQKTGGEFYFQYSPESFPGTEVDYALDIVNSVLEVWEPAPGRKAYINIPTTVENAMPHIFAGQIEYIHKHIKSRDSVILSVHPHNDRGCGVSDAEYGLLAGAQRVEGTLFGNGERTGNVDLVTLAMNMYVQGVNPELDFSAMEKIVAAYERLTKMKVHERQPYSGSLVFTAFSGSHQDAIAKSMDYREREGQETWDVPYIPVDPGDLGRNYEKDVIRINSQSGKGGIGYLLHTHYGIKLPYKMNEELGYLVKSQSDNSRKEFSHKEIYRLFWREYLELDSAYAPLRGTECLDEAIDVIRSETGWDFMLECLEKHDFSDSGTQTTMAFAGIVWQNRLYWGAGQDKNAETASVHALKAAVSRLGQRINRHG